MILSVKHEWTIKTLQYIMHFVHTRPLTYQTRLLVLITGRSFVRNGYCSAPDAPKWRILFFGNDAFSLKSLSTLNESRLLPGSRIKQIDVVTSFKHKKSPIIPYADAHSLARTDWPMLNMDECVGRYDVGVVVSFGQLLPAKMINAFPYGILNVHASLLPKWRGACPIIHSLLNGDAITGVSIMQIHAKKMDVGEILSQRQAIVPDNVLMPELHDALSKDGADLLLECIEDLPASVRNARPQTGDATYAPKLPKTIGKIDWQRMTSIQIKNLYRAIYSIKWPATQWHGKRINIREIELSPASDTKLNLGHLDRPGSMAYDKVHRCLHVYCVDGQFVRIKRLQVDSRNIISARDFHTGYLDRVDPCDRYFT